MSDTADLVNDLMAMPYTPLSHSSQAEDIAKYLLQKGYVQREKVSRKWLLDKVAQAIEDDVGVGCDISIDSGYYQELRKGKYRYGVTKAIDDILEKVYGPVPLSQRIEKAKASPKEAWEFVSTTPQEDLKQVSLEDLYQITTQLSGYKP